mgnify:CR=1 FL=1
MSEPNHNGTRTPTNAERATILGRMSQSRRDDLVALWQSIDTAPCTLCDAPIGGRHYLVASEGRYTHVQCPGRKSTSS